MLVRIFAKASGIPSQLQTQSMALKVNEAPIFQKKQPGIKLYIEG